jgi:Peptidase S46
MRTNAFFCRWAMLAVVAISGAAAADEGMWTFNNFPSDKVAQKYGFKPDQPWLDKVRLGSARLAQGCSASFVSSEGLVMTNHHCAHECIEQLSKGKKDYVKDGFLAKANKDEVKCPEMEVNQLVAITDVTKRIQDATSGKTGGAFADAQKAEESKIRQECATSVDVRCDVVTLYSGGVYNLYKYKRYQDVRLVFAPEFSIAFFGGDPDNFMFPRYDLDLSLIRVYENGKPLSTTNFLPFAKTPAKAGDLVFTSGHPGRTSRSDAVSELVFGRDVDLPSRLLRAAELRGMLNEYQNRGAEQARHSNATLFYVENSFKARKGYYEALRDPAFVASKVKEQETLVASVKDAKKKAELQAAFSQVDGAVNTLRSMYLPYMNIEAGWAFYGDIFPIARGIVRAADEKLLPNEKRLKGYTDADLPALEQMLFSEAPVFKEFEIAKLTFGLTKLRETLGADHALVAKILGKKSPKTLAKELMATKMVNAADRKKLYAAGKTAVEASKDPMIVLARLIDAEARALRKRYEDDVEGVIEKANMSVAKARFNAYGTSVYPDATFSLRLSFGAIDGWKEPGGDVAAITTIGGAFGRQTGEDPFKLPASWMKAEKQLNAQTSFNFASTNDIIGGNSGSPVVNKDGNVVGLIFDGNIHSLGGDYGYEPKKNRAVAVHTAAILETLEKVYGAKFLADELTGAKAPLAVAPAQTAPIAGVVK